MTSETGRRSVLVLSHLYPSPAFPGSGPFVGDQVRELARGNTISVIAPARVAPLRLETARRVAAVPKLSEEDGIRIARPRFPGVPIGGISLECRLWASRLRSLMGAMFAEIEGDLVHAHFALPDGFVGADFASRKRVPLVVTLWGSDVLQLGHSRRARRLLRQTFDEARALIAISDELAARAEAIGAAGDRLRVIAGGVPYPPRVSFDDARRRLGIDDDTVCVVWVGGLVPVKQPLDAVLAFESLVRACGADRRLVLVMIGDGPLRDEVRRSVREKGLQQAVRLLGYCRRDTVWSWQRAADVLINCSETEGTPVAVLEALGAGTPVVGYPLQGVRAAVDAVSGGRMAAGKTPEDLAAAVAEELGFQRDRSELARAARERYGIEKTCRAIEDVYRTIT
jgi:teichuronic acid biosynthesis glycosyltransferase TuaC